MDCCNYGEYRAHGHAAYAVATASGWEPYGPYALPYAPYAHGYYAAHAHDPYARYAAYRYDYPAAHHAPHTDHGVAMDYGPYSSKEMRVRRALARRDARSRTPIQHLPLPLTPPLECSMNGRGPAYCEPQMWHHYQMNGGGWSGGGTGVWASRTGLSCSREQMRFPSDFRSVKGLHPLPSSITYPPDGRSTPFSGYEESPYGGGAETLTVAGAGARATGGAPGGGEAARAARARARVEAVPAPPVEKRPALVPLPAFQQAFGSTEIGKFAEAFSRTELPPEEAADTFAYESFSDWENPSETQWSSQTGTREIKCEENF